VVDQHFLAGDDVELVLDQGVDQVPGEVLVALVGRQGRDAPALVGVAGTAAAAPTAKVGILSRKNCRPWSL
jgi:hypothetical protein